jgi:hypothetical protein
MKRTPQGEGKTLKPCAYKQSELRKGDGVPIE